MSRINWIHLSDLHVGMAAQTWLWPRYERAFFEDLSRHHEKSGPWHFILFTGDLVRTGSASEFQTFDEIFGRILLHMKTLGSNPKLVTLPGNHDLTRPHNLDSIVLAMDQYNARLDLQKDFWSDDEAGYRAAINKLFMNYQDWRSNSINGDIHAKPVKEGMLIGDASYVIDIGDVSAKIVTLNSTWLQISDGDHKGRLSVTPLQFIKAMPEDPETWLSQASLAIIATHQPLDWLDPGSQADWRSEIYTADRFALHSFGHMHTPDTKTYSSGGGKTRREFQATALFGLEKTRAGVERIQGYSAISLNVDPSIRRLSVWPRRLLEVSGGERKLKGDPSQDLDEDNSFQLDFAQVRGLHNRRADESLTPNSFQARNHATRGFKVSNIELVLTSNASHAVVRLPEQQAAESAWNAKSRAFWLCSDWGFGEEAFVGSVRERAGPLARCYRISLADFKNKADFLERVRSTYGASFEEICDRIDSEDGVILILSDVQLQSPPTPECNSLVAEIESLVYATKDYLERARFVVTSKTAPSSRTLPLIELKPLDEPDIRSYVAAHLPQNPGLADAATVVRLYQLTDGHPGRLDAALRQLEVISLNELIRGNTDLEPTQRSVDVPLALPLVMQELRTASTLGERSYELLQSLSLFPSGEQLERIKRFDNTKPYFADHATTLLDRHLIEAVTYSQMGDNSTSNNARLLVVPRPVREFMRASFSDAESERFDRRAVELYFGSEWKAGLVKGAIAARIASNPLAPPHEIHNCNTVLLRAIVRAHDTENEIDLAAAIRLSVAFVTRLIAGGHYRSALSLTEDLVPLLSDGHDDQLPFIQTQRAKCLRMIGRRNEAEEIYLSIDTTELPKPMRQEIFLGLALSYQTSGRNKDAMDAASTAVQLSKNTALALQARTILAELESAGPARDIKLDKLLQKAKSKKYHILENNIKLFKARSAPHIQQQALRRAVITSAQSSGDFYNRFRAMLDLFENRVAGTSVSDIDKLTLIAAYHFFHNERLNESFNRIHRILWTLFEENGDILNLLSLFRHSSFIWRLAGFLDSERNYVELLQLKHDRIVMSNVPLIERERSYFLARLQAIIEG